MDFTLLATDWSHNGAEGKRLVVRKIRNPISSVAASAIPYRDLHRSTRFGRGMMKRTAKIMLAITLLYGGTLQAQDTSSGLSREISTWTGVVYNRALEGLTDFEDILEGALAGDSSLQYVLGNAYYGHEYEGRAYRPPSNFPQDYDKAFFWWHMAAEQEVVEAYLGLAHAYANGNGVP